MDKIHEYIQNQPKEMQERLNLIHQAIILEAPQLVQKIVYGMPTYWEKENVIHFACFKKHIGVYPTPNAIMHFKDILISHNFKWSKGAFQIQHNQEIPISLIEEMVKFRIEEIQMMQKDI